MAGRIPPEFIDELLHRVDIVEVIDARVPLKKAGKDYKACCPFHDEKTPSFTVSSDKQFYHCFGCGKHGSAIGFLMEYDHMAFREAVEELAARVHLPLPESGASGPGDALDPLYAVLAEADRFYRRQLREHPQAADAVVYLKGRGLTGEIAASFGIGFAPEGWDHLVRAVGTDEGKREALIGAGLAVRKDQGGIYDRFRGRVMFPIHDYRGRLIGFGGRVIGKGEPKYLNSPETALFHKGRELYGLYRARDAIKRENRVLVVEGYMDVVGLAQYGIDLAVATLGTATTPEHLERLFRYTTDIVFCFDGDRAGREAAWRALENALPVLGEARAIGFLFLPEGEDPDTLVRQEGAEAFRARLAAAQPLSRYLLARLSDEVDRGTPEGRARLVEKARPLLLKVPDGPVRAALTQQLAEVARFPADELRRVLGGQGVSPPTPTARAPVVRADQLPRLSTPMRMAAALLVQNPGLAADTLLAELEPFQSMQGGSVLYAVAALLKARPELNTAAVVEHFRDSAQAEVVARLAVWQHEWLAQDPRPEFVGALRQLRRRGVDEALERLSSKDRLEGLSTADKQEFQRLLLEKQALNQTSAPDLPANP